jgi:hypothetical protein
MKEKTVRGYLRNKEGVAVKGEYTMSKSLTIVVEEIEKRTGFKVVNYIIEHRPLCKEGRGEFYEWCLIERSDEAENIEISHYYNKGEEPYGDFVITADLEDSARIRNDKYNLIFNAGRYVEIYREDLVSDEKFLKLLEE